MPPSKEAGTAGSGPKSQTPPPALTDAEDVALVEQTLKGQSEAFEKLFVKYRQRAFAVAWRLVRDEDAALDVVQDAFVRAYEQLEHLKGEGRFYPWLRRITVNLAIDRLRQAKRGAQVSLNDNRLEDGEEGRDDRAAMLADDSRESRPVEAAELSEFSSALSAALMKLSDTHRAVFMLHAAEGMSYKEIAEALDCNIGTVMSRLFYARKHLQELLGPHLKESDA
ncbi:MAG TPA: sigma-70 family RNA polymerase sigma factor [Planctomycetota bacterium]|nr:sigma-70 family RNA polymerase sigma factor [Planctomycetota bacterium]